MKRLLLLCFAIALVSCSQAEPKAITSPSGAYSAKTEISGDEAGPTRRICVRLRVVEVATKKEMQFQTAASDRMKWAMEWSPKSSLVLYSSDAGTTAYDVHNGSIVERVATEEEKEVGRHAYEKKYGNKPRA